MRIKVVAITDSKLFGLTKGKIYETDRPVNERQENYHLVNDRGYSFYFDMELFKPLDEYRDVNSKTFSRKITSHILEIIYNM